MKEILQYFKTYPTTHPFKDFVENGFDDNLKPRIPDGVACLNMLHPVVSVLQRLKEVCPEAYSSMLQDKLAARKGRDDFDAHNFVSALCELSVINAFISASDSPDTFKYEPKLIEDSKKNVEFSIEICGVCYNVEVKSANMIKEYKALEQNMAVEGQTIEPNARLISFDDWKNIAGETPLMGSLDNKIKDFIEDAQKKFPPAGNAINLLVICWDGRYRKALTALKSEASGLLTANSYVPDLKFDHISHIMVTSQYGFLIDWLKGSVPIITSQDPINLRFAYNFLIDYNTDRPKGIRERLECIMGCQELPVVDEKYVDQNCEDVSFTLNL